MEEDAYPHMPQPCYFSTPAQAYPLAIAPIESLVLRLCLTDGTRNATLELPKLLFQVLVFLLEQHYHLFQLLVLGR